MQVTEVIEQEHENPFGIHSIKEKLVNISSGVTLNDDIAGNIFNVADAGKSRTIYFRQRQLISKNISFYAVIKKSNYKSFRYVVQKIRIAKIDGGVKVEEVNKSMLGILLSYSLKTGKPVDFKKALPYALFAVHLSISNPMEVVVIQQRASYRLKTNLF